MNVGRGSADTLPLLLLAAPGAITSLTTALHLLDSSLLSSPALFDAAARVTAPVGGVRPVPEDEHAPCEVLLPRRRPNEAPTSARGCAVAGASLGCSSLGCQVCTSRGAERRSDGDEPAKQGARCIPEATSAAFSASDVTRSAMAFRMGWLRCDAHQ